MSRPSSHSPPHAGVHRSPHPFIPREHNALPDLAGCKVFVYGRTGKSNREVENIQRFWEQYFATTNADLIAYDYETDNVISAYMMLPH